MAGQHGFHQGADAMSRYVGQAAAQSVQDFAVGQRQVEPRFRLAVNRAAEFDDPGQQLARFS
jgi:hypothetical protein